LCLVAFRGFDLIVISRLAVGDVMFEDVPKDVRPACVQPLVEADFPDEKIYDLRMAAAMVIIEYVRKIDDPEKPNEFLANKKMKHAA